MPPESPGAEPVRRAWTELLAAAGQAGYAAGELTRPPASAEQLAAAEAFVGRRFPPDLAALYRLDRSSSSGPTRTCAG